MAGGFMVKGSHGIVQIDQNYRNLVLQQSGSFAGDAVTNTVQFAGVTPVLVLYPNARTTNCMCVQAMSVSNGTYTWTINGPGRWFIFDVISADSGKHCGLQVFKPGVGLIYDSGYQPMRALGLYSFTPNGGVGTSIASGFAGRTVGVAVSTQSWFLENNTTDQPPVIFIDSGMYAVYQNGTGGDLLLAKYRLLRVQGNHVTAIYRQGQIFAVDLTGYF